MTGYDFVFHCTPEKPYTQEAFMEAFAEAGLTAFAVSSAVVHDFIGRRCENCGTLHVQELYFPRRKKFLKW